MANSIEASNLKAVINEIKKIPQEVEKLIQDEFAAFALKGVADAKRNAPVDLGALRNSISYNLGNDYVELVCAVYYAAYVEFGTGRFAALHIPTLPQEIQEYAAMFRGQKVLENGMAARPFLYPAFKKNYDELIKRLNQELK